MVKKKINCCECGCILKRDVVALNKKILGRKIDTFFCLACFALNFDIDEDVLEEKIEDFKLQGCGLFK